VADKLGMAKNASRTVMPEKTRGVGFSWDGD
jgi:hypothetical protein